MSVESWIQEFYPEDAGACSAQANPVQHSLRKWQGALPENLVRHGVAIRDRYICDVNDEYDYTRVVMFGAYECALCLKFRDLDNSADTCRNCPITAATGTPCAGIYANGTASPYRVFLSKSDPKPMIAVLEQTLEFVQQQSKELDPEQISAERDKLREHVKVLREFAKFVLRGLKSGNVKAEPILVGDEDDEILEIRSLGEIARVAIKSTKEQS